MKGRGDNFGISKPMKYDVENYLDLYLKKDLDWEVTFQFLSQMRCVHEEVEYLDLTEKYS